MVDAACMARLARVVLPGYPHHVTQRGVRSTPFYPTLLRLLIPGPFALRRFLRVKRGLCPKCAYPMGESSVCTECGKPVPEHAVALNDRPLRG